MPSNTESLAIALASDHAGFELKATLVDWLRAQGHAVDDLGPTDTASVDYPDYGYRLAEHVAAAPMSFGIAVCGSGIGISIALNRHFGIRCALVGDVLAARLARQHNDANVLALGARLIGVDQAKECVRAFLAEPFAGDRHAARVAKLSRHVFVQEPV